MTKKEYAKRFRELPDALSAVETAEALRVNVKTVYKLIRADAIPAVRVGREYRVAKGALIDFLRSAEKKNEKRYVLSDNSSRSA